MSLAARLHSTPDQVQPRVAGKAILVLCHRLPYPPDKGDRIRSYHLLRHLAQGGWRIHLAALADHSRDLANQERLRPMCASLAVEPRSGWGRYLSPLGALRGTSMSVECFRNRRLQRHVDQVLATEHVDAVLAVCSPMAEYVLASPGLLPRTMVLDLVDVDSQKWRAYAEQDRGPGRWLYGLEARLLGRYERLAGQAFGNVVLVSEAEADLFRSLNGDGCKVLSISNGVDLRYFSPDNRPEPVVPGRIVFCGAMDYPPNIDAVTWFANEVFPLVRAKLPESEFVIVGANPVPRVRSLAELANVRVTGPVKDVRPYVASAALSVAPLRLARGLQNKVLEAMAMAKAVLATPQAFEGIEAEPGRDLAVARDSAMDFAKAALGLLGDPQAARTMGSRARRQVEKNYSWEARLAPLTRLLGGS